MPSSNVEVMIEELVLHGFTPGDRYYIGDAIERELTRLLAEQGLPPHLAHRWDVAGIDAGAFEVSAEARTRGIGAQVAQAVYRGLGDQAPGSNGR